MKVAQYVSLVNVQAKMALRADASRYYLGYLWWVFEPLLYVALFYVVFELIMHLGKANYLIFLICGKLPFTWFSKTVNKASTSIITARSLIGKIDVSKTLFPMAVVQEGAYKQIAIFFFMLVILIIFGFEPTSNWIWLIPIVIVNYVMIVACSLLGAAIVCVVRDFERLISLGMFFLIFASGIFWDVHDIGNPEQINLILSANPIAFLIDAYRGIFMRNQVPDLVHLAVLGVTFVGVALLANRLITRYSQYLALKVLTA